MTEQRHTHHLQAVANKGFTLIEVLMVMAIIGVLAKIAIPAYADYVEKARIKIAAQDIVTISAQIKLYVYDAESYPDSLADIGLAGKLDPWDNPYMYLNLDKNGNGGARRDHNLNPLNSDFDLYSRGKDNKTKLPITQKDSLDDILRANDGKFIDLAKHY